MLRHKNFLSRSGAARTSLEFVGLAAAVAFIAGGAKATSISDGIPHQLHQEMSACLNNTGETLRQSCGLGDTLAVKVYHLAQSTQGDGTEEEDDDDEYGADVFDYNYEIIPYDQDTLPPITDNPDPPLLIFITKCLRARFSPLAPERLAYPKVAQLCSVPGRADWSVGQLQRARQSQ